MIATMPMKQIISAVVLASLSLSAAYWKNMNKLITHRTNGEENSKTRVAVGFL